jgi:SAM-dependent methyltransferase
MRQPIISRIVKKRIFRKSPAGIFLRLNKVIWNCIPTYFTNIRLIRSYGSFLHNLVCLLANRQQYFGTLFFRNRPALKLIQRMVDRMDKCGKVRIAVLGCSNGAEVYSILWTIRSARPDITVIMNGLDISQAILNIAREGVYSLEDPDLVDAPIFERVTREEMRELFDREGDNVKIKPCLKEGIQWHLGDAGDPEILGVLGPQDMVIANNFLCHMDPPDQERVLYNISRLVEPGGYLFVSGIDLDVRTKVAYDNGWKPCQDGIEDIHDGDPILRNGWPLIYWGLEPFDVKRKDCKVRYASVFQIGEIKDCEDRKKHQFLSLDSPYTIGERKFS